MEDLVKENVKIFRKIADNLSRCRKQEENKGGKFSCLNCEYLGDCIMSISESVAGISAWLANFCEGYFSQMKKRDLF